MILCVFFGRTNSFATFHLLDSIFLQGYGRLKSALMSSLKITDSSTASKVREQYSPKLARRHSEEGTATQRADTPIVSDISDWKQIGNFLRVELPGHGSTVVSITDDMTFQDVVQAVTKKRQLDSEMYFIMFGIEKHSQIGNFFRIFLYFVISATPQSKCTIIM